jgi:hypothetical protein
MDPLQQEESDEARIYRELKIAKVGVITLLYIEEERHESHGVFCLFQ